MRYYLWIFILAHSKLSVFAQYQTDTIISGKIYDSQSKEAIEYATIRVLSKSDSTISGFTFTDHNGFFSLELDTLRLESKIIEIAHLFYESKVIDINDFKTDSIYLDSKELLLSEVVVRDRPRIKESEDTVSFNISYYRDTFDYVIADVINKIPGIQTDLYGNIKVHGVPIHKLLIDGEDLSGSDYGVLINNIRAKIVSHIEIIYNFIEDEILNGFFSSEAIALNLRIDDDEKNRFSIGTKTSLGIKNKLDSRNNLIYLGNDWKAFGFTDINNTLRSYSPSVYNRSLFTIDRSMNVFLDSEEIELSDLQNSVKDHFDKSIGLRALIPWSNKFKMVISNQLNDADRESLVSDDILYIGGGEAFYNTNTNEQNILGVSPNMQMKYKILPTVQLDLSIGIYTQNISNLSNNNDTLASSDSRGYDQYYWNFQATNKIWSYVLNQFKISGNGIGNETSSSEMYDFPIQFVLGEPSITHSALTKEKNYKNRISNSTIMQINTSFKVQVDATLQSNNYRLSSNNILNEELFKVENEIERGSKELSLSIDYSFLGNWKSVLTSGALWINQSGLGPAYSNPLEDQWTPTFLKFEISKSWNTTKKWQMSYNRLPYIVSPIKNTSVFRQINRFQTFSGTLDRIMNGRNEVFEMRYSTLRSYPLIEFVLVGSINRMKSNYINQILTSESRIMHTSVLFEEINASGKRFEVNVNKEISAIQSHVNLTYKYDHRRYQNSLNGVNQLNNLMINHLNWTFTTGFNFPISFRVIGAYERRLTNVFSSYINTIYSTRKNLTFLLKYNTLDNIYFELWHQISQVADNTGLRSNFSYTHLNILWLPKKSKLRIELKAKNILNRKNINSIFTNDHMFMTQSIDIMPFFCTAGIEYSF